jgi:hypothetical protein
MTSETRLVASVKALSIIWLLSGLVFCLIIKGPGTLAAWTIWGSAVFIAGWVVVALPLIALGDRVFRIPAPLLVFAGGLTGALLMWAPSAVVRIVSPDVHYVPFSIRELAWPGLAFAVAAPATGLYLFFLKRARWPKANFSKA